MVEENPISFCDMVRQKDCSLGCEIEYLAKIYQIKEYIDGVVVLHE